MNTAENGYVPPDYQAELDSILYKPLTAEGIDAYADTALEDLIEVVNDATKTYHQQPTVSFDSNEKIENATFSYYSLGDINATLDHIAAKAEEIRSLDAVIERAAKVDTVIVPPDPSLREPITAGDGSFQEKETIARLKTVLFVLSNEFGIDVHDPEQLNLTQGALQDDMMRKSSYYLVEAKAVDRTLLVCDEKGNITYVFDAAALRQASISGQDLMDSGKAELDYLIKEDSQLGQRLIYSANFVSNIVATLRGPTTVPPQRPKDAETTGTYLVPPNPEGYLSIHGIAQFWGVGDKITRAAAAELADELGAVREYRFGSWVARGFSPSQQLDIAAKLEANGMLAPEAPDEVLSRESMGKLWGIDDKTLETGIDAVKEQLGSIDTYRFYSARTEGFSPHQQNIIWNYLQETGMFVDKAEAGVVSAHGMSKQFGVSYPTIVKTIGELGNDIGKVENYKFGTRNASGYTIEQQEMIAGFLSEKGMLTAVAPEGYVSCKQFAKQSSVSRERLDNLIDEFGEEVGLVEKHRYFGKVAPGLSPEQQAILRQHLQG